MLIEVKDENRLNEGVQGCALRSYLGSKVGGICKRLYRVRPLKKGISRESVAPGT